jgi:demethylmenaquinone methyltransferase/2-methoxy-6-polyprenyl-1,4-benzoquinol methylase
MKKSLRNVAEAYDRTAPFYDLLNRVYFFGRDSQFRSLLVENLNLKPNYTVLDLCFGTGLDFSFLQDKMDDRGTIVGVDLSLQMLQQSKEKKGSQKMNLIRADIGHLPFRDYTFNAIMVSFCLKIIPTYEPTIKELTRVLQLHGRIGILANHKPQDLKGKIITKILSVTAKIDYEINLTKHINKKFTIIKNIIMHGDLVQLIIVENIKKTI